MKASICTFFFCTATTGDPAGQPPPSPSPSPAAHCSHPGGGEPRQEPGEQQRRRNRRPAAAAASAAAAAARGQEGGGREGGKGIVDLWGGITLKLIFGCTGSVEWTNLRYIMLQSTKNHLHFLQLECVNIWGKLGTQKSSSINASYINIRNRFRRRRRKTGPPQTRKTPRNPPQQTEEKRKWRITD